MDKLVKTLGITGLSKSQVSRMATDLDEHVEQFRNRPLDDADPFTFVAADALTMKVLAWIIVHGEQRYRCAAYAEGPHQAKHSPAHRACGSVHPPR